MLRREEVKKILQQLYEEKLGGYPEDIHHVEIDDNYDFVVMNQGRTFSVHVPRDTIVQYMGSDPGRKQAEEGIIDILAWFGGTPASY
jgi:hypothetical protein